MDDSLFNTRQLTEYRRWPTGENGCLFYVIDTPLEKERSQGAVYLIDAEYRKGDRVGAYNILHQSEINSLQNLQPIVKGFAAFLFTQDNNQWIEDRTILGKWWARYYEWCQEKRPRSGFETEYILCECQNWTMRAKEIITCYLLNPNMEYLYKDAMRHVIKDVLYRNTTSLNDIMRKWHPYITLPNNDSLSYDSDYIQYDYYANALIHGTQVVVSGIQAIIIQFSAIRHATQEISKAQNLDSIVNYLLNQLGDNSLNTLTIDKIRIPEYDMEKAQKLYAFSWSLNKERLEPLYNRDASYYIMSDQEKEWGLVSHLCKLELKHCRNNEIISRLSPEEAQNMRRLLSGYFGFLYNKLKGSNSSDSMFNEIVQVFPELQKGENAQKNEKDFNVKQIFNIQGDYIAGDKHVGAHIENVEPGGIGTQIK